MNAQKKKKSTICLLVDKECALIRIYMEKYISVHKSKQVIFTQTHLPVHSLFEHTLFLILRPIFSSYFSPAITIFNRHVQESNFVAK